MRRVTSLPAQDATCIDKRLNYKSKADFERFLKGQIQGYLDTISGYTGAQIEELKNSKDPAKNSLYMTALTNLQLAENNLNSHIQCLNKDILQRNDYSSKMYSIQQEIEGLRKEVKQKKEIVDEAKERANLLENPYSNTTWNETWFPLGRPIQKENVPVLLATSILMLVFSLGIFLRFAGLEVRIDSLRSNANSLMRSPMNYRR